ncbi:hypothetical protein SAMN05421806_10921 [Streptomyces indicus]|uniref:Magnesium transporter NIPA n=1 Tax=Streptomyces indicus TaxID=417292 RepID=A0A1G9D4R1_9ACTN|nr:hypothetical protein SAMN05421806_10921 [Streptomyces indicus]
MWWGVAAALLANTLYSVGFVLEKRALTAMPSLNISKPFRLLAHVLSSPLWVGGAVALAAGFGAQLLVYRTLPIAAAQGIFVSGLVLLVILSARMLGERTSGRERWAIGAILAALLMVVLSLKEGADQVGTHAPVMTVILVCVPSLAAGLWLYAAVEGRARNRHRLPTSGVEYGVAVGLLYGVSSLAIKGVSSHLLGEDDRGFTDRFLDLLISPYPYLLCCTGVFGLIMSAAALQRSRASLIVPVCTTVTCLYTAVLGTLAYGEPLPTDPVRLGLRLAGTGLAVVVLLALPRHDADAGAGSGTGAGSGAGEAEGVRDGAAVQESEVAVASPAPAPGTVPQAALSAPASGPEPAAASAPPAVSPPSPPKEEAPTETPAATPADAPAEALTGTPADAPAEAAPDAPAETPPPRPRPTRRPPPPIAPSGRTIPTHLPRRVPPPAAPPRPHLNNRRKPRS